MNEMSELRNKITHTGEHDPGGESPTFEFLNEKLGAVRDLLWLLDYYSGHRWAQEHVSGDRVKELRASDGKPGKT
jgi:hypothetical protein